MASEERNYEHADMDMSPRSYRRDLDDSRRSKSLDGDAHLITCDLLASHDTDKNEKRVPHKGTKTPWGKMKDIIQTRTGSVKKKKTDANEVDEDAKCGTTIEVAHFEESPYDFESPAGEVAGDRLRRRLAPTLTITLPSTEELRRDTEAEAEAETLRAAAKPPPSPQQNDHHERHLRARPGARGADDEASQARKISGGSAGTSPPTPRRLSKWSKVKNAFLTSSASASEDCLHRGSSSVPSSPVNKTATFAYDLESDELSSGEFMDEGARDDDVFPDMCGLKEDTIHAEVQRNYEALQLKLSEEFHKKLCEWERIKYAAGGGGPGTPPCASRVAASSGFSSGTSSVADDPPHDRGAGLRKKTDDWEKSRGARHRESVTLQQLGEENLSAEFKKKLEEWERIKALPSPQTPDIVNIAQPQFRKKISEWQLWRGTTKGDSGASGATSPPPEPPEEFYKKMQEWERLKSASFGHPEADTPGNKTPSPGSSRRDSDQRPKTQTSPHKKDKGAEFGFQIRIQKSKSHHEVKELAWLEKELHKIEREKQRLEREREKYLEREARLEKLRKAIGANLQKQEILIPTSTGLFRFEGISQKFTRKLYEWEKAKGIGPEASTFALLDPGYQPPGAASDIDCPEGNGSLLARSKSMGSVIELNQSTLTHQPSSLSLSHMEQFESNQLSTAFSEDEPQALIVDIEDVIEETASPLEQAEVIECQTPVYCYAPSEVTRLIDSSGSDSDKELKLASLQAQSSIELLQENFTLLDKLQKTEHICRELEGKIEDVEDKLTTTERIHKEHLGCFPANCDEGGDVYTEQEENLEDIKERLVDLETRQEQLRQEGEVLQHSFAEHSEQQAMIAQDLVGKVRQLQDNISGVAPENPPGEPSDDDPLRQVQALTHQLLNLAQELELAVGERNQEMSVLRKALSGTNRSPGLQKLRTNPHWFSTDSVSSVGVTENFPSKPSSEELSRLPVLLTRKLQELKNQLGSLSSLPCSTKPAFFTQKPLNIIVPESPEVETTFVFNLGKKRRNKEVTIQKVSDTILCDQENPRNNSFALNELSTTTSDVFYQDLLQEEQNNKYLLEYHKSRPNDNPGIYEQECLVENEANNSCTNITEPIKPLAPSTHETYFVKKPVHISTDSDDTDCDKNCLSNASFKEASRSSDSENAKEKAVMKKHKRTKLNSGLLERRRSRTDSKDENTDDEDQKNSESRNSKKTFNYELRYKKMLRTKNILRDGATNGNQNSSGNNDMPHSSIQTNFDSVLISGKSITSPKCVSRRIKKTVRPLKDDKEIIGTDCGEPYNNIDPCLQEASNQEMTVNVFVPTTRTIFSPVRKDSKGDTSTVISYVLEEPGQTISVDNKDETKDLDEGVKKNSDETILDAKLDEERGKEKNTAEEGVEEDTRPKYDFVLPPCWIIKQVRAQSASPALKRRTLHRQSNNKEIPNDNEGNVSHLGNKNLKTDYTAIGKRLQTSEILCSSEPVNDVDKNTGCGSDPLNTSKAPQTSSSPCKDSALNHIHRKTSSSSESVENNRALRKEGCAIPSSLKLRTEAGFPPISPLTVRREMKVLKDTAPSIRLMIAKYNQKVHQSQELSRPISPESGGHSPIAWRSPVSERRVRGHLERYHDEVRRALQTTCRNECCADDKLGKVQKSASAGYIRPLDKGCSSDSINGKTSEKSSPLLKQNRGILKSSSAGAIKSCSLLPSRPSANVSESTCVHASKEPPPSLIQKEEQTSSSDLNQTAASRLTDLRQSSDFRGGPQEFHAETVKSRVLPAPAAVELETVTDYSQVGLDSIRLRALKIKKAKEEFLSRGCEAEGNTTPRTGPSTPDGATANERLSWTNSRSRLSQASCGSESSYENVPAVLVGGRSARRDLDGNLLVKSASAGMINVESSARAGVPATSIEASIGQGAIPKSRSGILSRFRKARLKRSKDKESRLDAVSALCRQSLVVDIAKGSDPPAAPSSSKSCPSSPVLHKKDQTVHSWIRNPKRIFMQK